ncbi:MAG: stage II sporulation protein R [Eubacteriales bacterium]
MRYFLIFTCSILVLTILICILPNTDEAKLYDGFIRLHVVANSDSEKDQALKLEVRDAVLNVMANLTQECTTVDQAESVFNENKKIITEAASEVIKENGADYNITVTLSNEYYPTREYAGISLPAGIYRSARILIGEAQGKNWWCILFPPLCINTAKAKEKLITAGFSQNQIRILTDGDDVKYKIKFRALELIEQLIAALSEKE